MTSTERSVMRLASSWMVITSGMITSRMTLSRGCRTPAWRSFSRSRRRLQRGQRTLPLRLVEGVVDGELDALALLVADLDGALGRLGALLLVRASSSASGSSSRARPLRLAICSTRLARLGHLGLLARARLGLRRRLLRVCGSAFSAARLAAPLPAGATGSSCTGFGCGLRPQRLQAGTLALLGLGALLGRSSARRRASSSSVDKPPGRCDRLGQQALRLGLRRRQSSPSPPAPEMVRFFFFSTTTDFERPWLKLCRTWPDSTVRFRLNGLRGARRAASSR